MSCEGGKFTQAGRAEERVLRPKKKQGKMREEGMS